MMKIISENVSMSREWVTLSQKTKWKGRLKRPFSLVTIDQQYEDQEEQEGPSPSPTGAKESSTHRNPPFLIAEEEQDQNQEEQEGPVSPNPVGHLDPPSI